jgi:hypothetical protein
MVESTGEAAGTAIGMARRQAADTNEAIFRSMGRLLGRRDEEGEDESDEDVGIDLGEVDSVKEDSTERVEEADSA